MFCIVSPYYSFYNNKFQRSTYYSLFLSILYRRRLGLTARPQLNSACFAERPQLNSSLEKEGRHLVHFVHFVQPRSALFRELSLAARYGELSVSRVSTALLLIYRLCLLRYTLPLFTYLKRDGNGTDTKSPFYKIIYKKWQ